MPPESNAYLYQGDKRAGKLKLFLGMVAGVGKTYAMLETARGLKAEGKDVVIGYLETHGRKKTEELSRGFEFIQRKKIAYQSAAIEEMDLDAILERKPDIVLVDELAHTNASGSRHPKRYMDVEEILRAGINVYSTINVQHFESRVDIVKNLSGIEIKESVPDSILDLADQIELIDLSPEDLLIRLERGEIYPPEKIERSLKGFFKKGTLTALRELSLRLAAEKVDREVISAVKNHDLPQRTKTRDRLLVAIGPSPSATELLRWTRNKAFNLEAPWIAAYIDTGIQLSVEDSKLLDENIELAKHLGAEIMTISNPSVAAALIELAKDKHVTEIVMGRPQMSFIHKLVAPESPVDLLLNLKESFTISIVTTDKIKTPSLVQLIRNRFRSNPGEYFFSFSNIAITTSLLVLLLPVIGYRGVGLVFMVAVLFQALITGRGPIYLSAFMAAVSWNYFFIPPRFTFNVLEREDLIQLVLFFIMATVLGSLTNKVRARELAFREREQRASFLFDVSKIFSERNLLEEILRQLAALIQMTLKLETSFFIQDPNVFVNFRPEGKTDVDEKERSVAMWCMNNLRRAGHDTETLPHARGIYYPLFSGNEVFGAIGFYPASDNRIDFSKKSILESVSKQLSLFLEKQNYFALKTKTRALEESAKLQKSLFSSISHEFKTPLTSLLGGLQAIVDTPVIKQDENLRSITRDILSSGARLTNVVDELLDMSRLESGKLLAKSEWVSLEEAVGLVLGRLEARLVNRHFVIEGISTLPLIKADFVLAADVIRNLVLNSLQYSDPHGKIEIRGSQNDESVCLEILDEGAGVSDAFKEKVFDRFSRENPNVPGGLGLGLSICHGLMTAMGGTIRAGNRSDGTSGFFVSLVFAKVRES